MGTDWEVLKGYVASGEEEKVTLGVLEINVSINQTRQIKCLISFLLGEQSVDKVWEGEEGDWTTQTSLLLVEPVGDSAFLHRGSAVCIYLNVCQGQLGVKHFVSSRDAFSATLWSSFNEGMLSSSDKSLAIAASVLISSAAAIFHKLAPASHFCHDQAWPVAVWNLVPQRTVTGSVMSSAARNGWDVTFSRQICKVSDLKSSQSGCLARWRAHYILQWIKSRIRHRIILPGKSCDKMGLVSIKGVTLCL